MVLLNRARLKVRDERREIPRYTCLQQTDRQMLELPRGEHPKGCYTGKRNMVEEDHIRLELAVGEDHEIYAWPGETTFDLNEPSQFGVGGAMATGLFAMLLDGAMVADADPASYRFLGRLNIAGRDMAEYSYHVPKARSHYTLADQFSRAIVGYQGTVRIDVNTADVVQLTTTLDIPVTSMDLSAARLVLEYRREKIQFTEPLLVQSVDMDMVHMTGEEAHNRTIYSGCHMFATESTVHFDSVDDAAPANAAAAPRAITDVSAPPAGLPFQMALTNPIDFEKQAIGDIVEATLTSDLKDERGRLLAAKGSKVQARIVSFKHYVNGNSLLLGLRPERLIRKDGVVSPIRASLAKTPKGAVFTLAPKGTPRGTAFFTFEKLKALSLAAGWTTAWVTIHE